MGRLLTLLRRKGGFSPLDLPGLALWLDASDLSTITHDLGAVSQWDDKSGNGRHVVQATAANQPTTGTRTLNGRNAIDFDGGDVMRPSAATLLAQPITLFWVAVTDVLTNTALADGFSGSSNRVIPGIQSGPWQLYGGSAYIDSGVTPVVGQTVVFRGVLNGASSSVAINNSAPVTGNQSSSWNMLSLGASTVNSSFWDGVMAEILVYGSALSASEIATTEAYLADKWGATLA